MSPPLSVPSIDEMYAFVTDALTRRGAALRLPSPEQSIESPTLQGGRPIEIRFKRDDLISPLFPGNKFRKLVPHIYRVLKDDHKRVLTFGGTYSNHLYAFASAVKVLQLEGIACVRGERVEPLNPLLRYVEEAGVALRFIDRSTYRERHSRALWETLNNELGAFYLIPEGGTDRVAVQSVARIAREATEPVDVVVTAVGTGGTLAGLANGFAGRAHVLGISSLKGASSLDDEVRDLIGPSIDNWTIDHTHHYGGFARTTPELWEFMQEIEDETGIRLDAIYTAKALAGLRDHIRASAQDSTYLFIHTGGIPIDTRDALLKQGR